MSMGPGNRNGAPIPQGEVVDPLTGLLHRSVLDLIKRALEGAAALAAVASLQGGALIPWLYLKG